MTVVEEKVLTVAITDESPEQFRIVATDIQDQSYFLKNIKSSQYLWCYAERELSIREEVFGIIKPPEHLKDFPTLVVVG